MVEKLNAMRPEAQIKEIVTIIFRKVFNKRLEYARGFGEMVIAKSTYIIQSDENAGVLS